MNPFANIKSSVLVAGVVAVCIAQNTSDQIDMKYSLECSKIICGNGEMNEKYSPVLVKCQIKNDEFRVEQEAKQLFGEMRETTVQERQIIQSYIQRISKPTGRNFWDQC